MTLPVLPIRDMNDRHCGLTKAVSDGYLEAARVSLDRHRLGCCRWLSSQVNINAIRCRIGMSWSVYHSQSEEFASEAKAALRKGDKEISTQLYAHAAEAESQALIDLDTSKTRTLGITVVSATSLWFKANNFKQAERIACQWIPSGQLPDFAISQLRALLQAIWSEEVFRESGIELVRGEVLVALHGGDIRTGAAPLTLINRKASEISSFFYRIIEMDMNRPFRKRGTPGPDITENFRPWLFQTTPGSYRFAVRLQKPPQMSLFPDGSPEVGNVAQKFVQIVRTAVEEPPEELEHTVPDKEYRSGFLKMSRNLAPTGKTFSRLEISSTYDPESIPVVLFPESRQEINKTLRREQAQEDDDVEPGQVVGVLRALHLDKDWLEILDNDDHLIRLFQTGDVIDDIVGPMVNQRVIANVSISKKDGRYLFRDIELEE